MTDSIRIETNFPLTMRDGVILRADVFRPDDSGKYPAILLRTPYGKEGTGEGNFFSGLAAVQAGYAVVIQDTRGRFASDGDFTAMMSEGEDGYDTVEAIAAESWCDGNVGMTGGSYLGRIQWQTAVEAPPHLKAMAPSICTSGPLSDSQMSGVVALDQNLSWYAAMTIDMLAKMSKQGKDVTKARAMVVEAMFNMGEVCKYLPVNEIPHFQFEGLKEGFSRRVGETALAGLESEEDLFWDFAKIDTPCLHTSGWYDLFGDALFINFMNMREKGADERARKGQHVFCGPWGHGPASAYVGDLHFGPMGSAIAALAHSRHMTFFDKYLKGIEPNPRHLPPVRYFVMGRNRWHSADDWPLPQTEYRRFFLHSRGQANTSAGNGLLSQDNPGAEPPDRFLYDPMNPVPTKGGRNLPSGSLVIGPLDQAMIERRSDVLCYTTPELKEPLEVTGPLKLHLFASTSAKDTDFMAKLVDVYPDGSSYNVAEGCIRARYRNSIFKPDFVTPGEVYEYIIDLGATGIEFRKGHCIRVDISPAAISPA